MTSTQTGPPEGVQGAYLIEVITRIDRHVGRAENVGRHSDTVRRQAHLGRGGVANLTMAECACAFSVTHFERKQYKNLLLFIN